MASNDALPTKRVLASVWMTRTAWPCLTASLAVWSALYAAIPPLTPRSSRPIVERSRLLPVVVLELALSDLFERDRQVVLGVRLHHRGREVVERALARVVVVGFGLRRA